MVALLGGPERSVGEPNRARQDRFRGGWLVAQRAVRADRVVMLPPVFDKDLCLLQAVEDFSVQKFISELPIEAFIVSILPRAARLDVERLHADPAQPVSDSVGCKLAAIVRPYVLRSASLSKQIRQDSQNIIVLQTALDMDREALPGMLVDHG